MKRSLVVFVALGLLAGLVGCGSGSSTESNDAPVEDKAHDSANGVEGVNSEVDDEVTQLDSSEPLPLDRGILLSHDVQQGYEVYTNEMNIEFFLQSVEIVDYRNLDTGEVQQFYEISLHVSNPSTNSVFYEFFFPRVFCADKGKEELLGASFPFQIDLRSGPFGTRMESIPPGFTLKRAYTLYVPTEECNYHLITIEQRAELGSYAFEKKYLHICYEGGPNYDSRSCDRRPDIVFRPRRIAWPAPSLN